MFHHRSAVRMLAAALAAVTVLTIPAMAAPVVTVSNTISSAALPPSVSTRSA